MIEVIPSLPAPTFAELEAKIGKVRGLVPAFQIDLCDGKFVPSVSWPMHPEDRPAFERIVSGEAALPYWQDFDFEIDIMAHHAEKLLPDWIQAGIVRALIHIETEHDFAACVAVAEGKIELGVALGIGTPVERIDGYIEHITVVQLMGIATIGRQGQPFDPRVLDSIREVKKRYPDVTIEVDGAVNLRTAPDLVAAGATRLAPGSYVLSADDPKAAVKALKNLSS